MTHIQKNRTLQTATTSLSGAKVLDTARTFFARQSGIYAAFVEQESSTHITLRGQGGEEIVVGVAQASGSGATSVTASSYMFDQQVAMFLAALPPVVSAGAAT